MRPDAPLTEADWRARDDARTLAVAEEIKADKARMDNATEAAVKMLEEEKKELVAISKVARKRPPRSSNAPRKRSTRGSQTNTGYNVFSKI